MLNSKKQRLLQLLFLLLFSGLLAFFLFSYLNGGTRKNSRGEAEVQKLSAKQAQKEKNPTTQTSLPTRNRTPPHRRQKKRPPETSPEKDMNKSGEEIHFPPEVMERAVDGSNLSAPLVQSILDQLQKNLKGNKGSLTYWRNLYRENPSMKNLKQLRLQESNMERTKAIIENVKKRYFFIYRTMEARAEYLKKMGWAPYDEEKGELISNYWYHGKGKDFTFETMLFFKDNPSLYKAHQKVQKTYAVFRESFIQWYNSLPLEERKRLGLLYKKKGVMLTKKGKYIDHPGGFRINEETWTMRKDK